MDQKVSLEQPDLLEALESQDELVRQDYLDQTEKTVFLDHRG